MRIAVVGALFIAACQGQMSLPEAVKKTSETYPQLRVSMEQVNAAAEAIKLARTAYLPRIEGIAQVNRATRNNIYGMLLPQTVIAPISGPPNPTNAGTNVWGSAIGFLVSWEPFDFGLRKAQVDAASASERRAGEAVKRTRFEAELATAEAYLTVLAAEQTAQAARASVKRSQTLWEQVAALVKAELRPGAEESRSRAELAMAETQRIQADQAVALARAALSQFVGTVPESLKGLREPPEGAGGDGVHPQVSEQEAAIEEVAARRRVLEKSYFPKFNAQAANYARGTGANADFTTLSGVNGLAPNIYNWGVGFTVNFNVMEYASLRVRKEIEASRQRAEAARLEQVRRELSAQELKAQALVAGARQVAANMPVQLEAARAAEQQAAARYRAGLGTIAEVAEAQRLLTQTEIDASLARLGIWRALLAQAAAKGQLSGFLQAAGN